MEKVSIVVPTYNNEKVLGKEHPHTAFAYRNLAYVYKKQEKYQEAEELYRKALAIDQKVLGEEHPDTKAIEDKLADLYENYKLK